MGTTYLRQAAIGVVSLIAYTAQPACVWKTESARDLERQAPESARGLSVGYDLTNLSPSPGPPQSMPPSNRRPIDPLAPGPTTLLAWWETPDGEVHHEEVVTESGRVDPSEYAGAVWFEVTALGAKPRRLQQSP